VCYILFSNVEKNVLLIYFILLRLCVEPVSAIGVYKIILTTGSMRMTKLMVTLILLRVKLHRLFLPSFSDYQR